MGPLGNLTFSKIAPRDEMNEKVTSKAKKSCVNDVRLETATLNLLKKTLILLILPLEPCAIGEIFCEK